MTIRVFGEGRTEGSVVRQIEPITGPVLYINVRGKKNFPKAIRNHLGPALDEPGGAQFVVLCDHDQGEELVDIQRSFQDVFQKAFLAANHVVPVEFAPHPIHPNIFTFQIQQPSARFALHVARPIPELADWQFTKSTTDDYVLALALLPPVASRFIQESKLPVPPEDFRRKVLREMPNLFSRNGIPLDEAKDLVGIYMAAARFLATKRTGAETFVSIVVGRAMERAEGELRQVLASLLDAVQFVAR
jgi:hypothetical protein